MVVCDAFPSGWELVKISNKCPEASRIIFLLLPVHGAA